MTINPRIIVLISANTEWRIINDLYKQPIQASPLGTWFTAEIPINHNKEPVVFFHGGWGKISAAATTQYVIDRWTPELLVNLGTCGGFRGQVERGTIILVEKTIVYDIFEQMADPTAALAHYTTQLDLSWLEEPFPHPVTRTHIVSGDRDLMANDVEWLKQQFGAVAGDWESGAIAYVAHHNGVKCLILRGVSDLVDAAGGDAYAGELHVFVEGAKAILSRLTSALAGWLAISNLSLHE